MIFRFFRKSTAPDVAYEAYRSIVAQSRQEKFYAQWQVPDTVTGRFDMISLHMALVMDRLKGDEATRADVQALVDLFFRDMDRSLRELGVTDLGVPKKVKAMGNIFYGLVAALGEALATGDAAAVEAVLVRNVYGAANPHAADLAAYLRDEAARLAALPAARVLAPSGAGVAA